MPTERHIQRARAALDVGAAVSDIRDFLLKEGLTEYQAFLCIKAAQLLSLDF
jgi:hypothetical protein